MNIADLRREPVLPDEYFEIYETLDARVRELALVGQPLNLATLHAVMAFEVLARELRSVGEREIHLRRLAGLPVGVTAFTIAMHGMHDGLTLLLRAIDNARAANKLPTEVNSTMQEEAVTSLRAMCGLTEMFRLMDDVAIGWRRFEVAGHRIRAHSRSPERLGRSIQLDIRSEVELNEPFLAASAHTPYARLLHEILFAAALAWSPGVAFEPSDEMLDLAEEGTRQAGDYLARWSVPGEVMVRAAFSVSEYRLASEAVKALAGAVQSFDDYCEPRAPARLIVKRRDEWTDFIRRRGRADADGAEHILTFLTHDSTDLHGGGRQSPSAAHTPFIDLGDGRLALVPTLAIWQDPQLALRTIWKTRAPGDYNAQVSALNHQLSEQAGAILADRGWPAVVRRNIPGAGDIDAGTGADELFVCGECKVFIDDPVRGADDPAVWRELERNVLALEQPEIAARTLAHERLAPREVVGLVIVPGRAQSPVDFGERYSLMGIDDLRDRAAEAATPRELWGRIKAHELRGAAPVVDVELVIGEWSIESDGVPRVDLIPSGRSRPT